MLSDFMQHFAVSNGTYSSQGWAFITGEMREESGVLMVSPLLPYHHTEILLPLSHQFCAGL